MERIADTSVDVAAVLDDADGDLPSRAETVVIGAGVLGASIACHLTAAGHRDVLVLDKNNVASGTSWHAAGLITGARSTPALTELARYGVDFYTDLGARSGVDVNVTPCGSLTVARTEGRLDEIRYAAAVARQAGIPCELLDAAEVPRLWPLASPDGLTGALHFPGDGHLNPGYAALAMVKLASEQGAAIRTGVQVEAIRLREGAVAAVVTDRGEVACARVVVAAGLWTHELARACGVNVPLYAAEHVHVRTEPIDGAVPTLPVLRDLDGYFYIRHELGRLLVGAFEPEGIPRPVSEIGLGGHVQFPPDWDHFAPVRRNAEARVPALVNARYDRFVNAPESFTPDANFCVGEALEARGFFVAAGLNSQGIIFAPGIGRAVTEWIEAGSATFDASSVDVGRFSRHQGNRGYLHARTHEALGRLYAMHWPHLQPTTARDLRRTPLHDRLAAHRACFGETAGWERANWYGDADTPPEYAYSYGRQNWFDLVGAEHRAAREAAALFDLSSFTKVEVAGPDALDVVQRLCTADLDMAVGRVKYTLMLNVNAGIELDGTVVRLADDRFLVITPAATQAKTMALARRLARGRAAAVFDATAGLATLALMGPRSRDIVESISPDDWSDDAQPFMTAREVEVGMSNALALRVSFVGELGYELYVSTDQAVRLFDDLMAAGREHGLRLAGYHALDSLRTEVGYRHLGHDIGPIDTPIAARLMFTVALDKEPAFVGRDALAALADAGPPARRQVFVALRDPGPVFVHDEALWLDGRVVGRLSSGSYGHTLGRACGLAYVDADLPLGAPVEADCGGVMVPAELSARPFRQPRGTR